MTEAVTSSFSLIKKYGLDKGCHRASYLKLGRALGGVSAYGLNTPIQFRKIYEVLGRRDTLRYLKATDSRWSTLWRFFAIECMKDVVKKDLYKGDIYLELAEKNAVFLASDKDLEKVFNTPDYQGIGLLRDITYPRASGAALMTANSAIQYIRLTVSGDKERGLIEKRVKSIQMERLFNYCEKGKRT